MNTKTLRFLTSLLFGVTYSFISFASSPPEKIICTHEPRSLWISEDKIKEIFEVKKFTLAKLKVSRGNCYEFYAIGNNGEIVEAYYHPVSGKVVRYNEIK